MYSIKRDKLTKDYTVIDARGEYCGSRGSFVEALELKAQLEEADRKAARLHGAA